eukprot:XP_001709291.1 Hypothetical protein GL50803_39189 [Giardia lamblia ATCC 50803]
MPLELLFMYVMVKVNLLLRKINLIDILIKVSLSKHKFVHLCINRDRALEI